jgi:hypothetical protein
VLLPQLTVWETLRLHAGLRLVGIAVAQREAHMLDVLRAMGLTSQRRTLVSCCQRLLTVWVPIAADACVCQEGAGSCKACVQQVFGMAAVSIHPP